MGMSWFQQLARWLWKLRLDMALNRARKRKEVLNQNSLSLKDAAGAKKIERGLDKSAPLLGRLEAMLFEYKDAPQAWHQELRKTVDELKETMDKARSRLRDFYQRVALDRVKRDISKAKRLVNDLESEPPSPSRAYGKRIATARSFLDEVGMRLGGLPEGEAGSLRDEVSQLRGRLESLQQGYNARDTYLTTRRHLESLFRRATALLLVFRRFREPWLITVLFTLSLFALDMTFLRHYAEFLLDSTQMFSLPDQSSQNLAPRWGVPLGGAQSESISSSFSRLRPYLGSVLIGLTLFTLGYKAGGSGKTSLRVAFLTLSLLLALPLAMISYTAFWSQSIGPGSEPSPPEQEQALQLAKGNVTQDQREKGDLPPKQEQALQPAKGDVTQDQREEGELQPEQDQSLQLTGLSLAILTLAVAAAHVVNGFAWAQRNTESEKVRHTTGLLQERTDFGENPDIPEEKKYDIARRFYPIDRGLAELAERIGLVIEAVAQPLVSLLRGWVPRQTSIPTRRSQESVAERQEEESPFVPKRSS